MIGWKDLAPDGFQPFFSKGYSLGWAHVYFCFASVLMEGAEQLNLLKFKFLILVHSFLAQLTGAVLLFFIINLFLIFISSRGGLGRFKDQMFPHQMRMDDAIMLMLSMSNLISLVGMKCCLCFLPFLRYQLFKTMMDEAFVILLVLIYGSFDAS